MSFSEMFSTKNWLVLAALLSAAMLGAAHSFERFGGMDPCQLCLRQREVYWAALLLIALLLVWQWLSKSQRFERVGVFGLAIVFLVGALIAGFHVGVELKFWPGPASCSGTMADLSTLSGDLLAALSQPAKEPGCGEVPWAMLGISMAGWNGLVSLGLAAISFKVALSPSNAKNSK